MRGTKRRPRPGHHTTGLSVRPSGEVSLEDGRDPTPVLAVLDRLLRDADLEGGGAALPSREAASHLRVLIADESTERVAVLAAAVRGLGHETVAAVIEVADVDENHSTLMPGFIKVRLTTQRLTVFSERFLVRKFQSWVFSSPA